MAKVAFVTGGNGITGSAIVEYLTQKTDASEWSRIVVTSRSPLQAQIDDPRVDFLALDFTRSPDELQAAMQSRCADVTHAYFSSYAHTDDFAQLNAANKALFENFLDALEAVAPRLANVTLQTGGKYYNLHLQPIPTPAREDDARRGDAATNFYFAQEDHLASRARSSSSGWSWNVVRPEAIIGATHKPNGMNSALTCAIYLLICRELGEEARMPTNQLYWSGAETNSDAGLLAAFSVWVSTTPRCAGHAFNAVNGDHFVWRYMWPRLAEWLGARAGPEQRFDKPVPPEGGLQQELSLAEWAKDKRPVWDGMCERAGVLEAKASFDAATWAFQDWVFRRTWNATLSMNKARKFGWTGFKDSFESMTEAFAKYRALGQIP